MLPFGEKPDRFIPCHRGNVVDLLIADGAVPDLIRPGHVIPRHPALIADGDVIKHGQAGLHDEHLAVGNRIGERASPGPLYQISINWRPEFAGEADADFGQIDERDFQRGM